MNCSPFEVFSNTVLFRFDLLHYKGINLSNFHLIPFNTMTQSGIIMSNSYTSIDKLNLGDKATTISKTKLVSSNTSFDTNFKYYSVASNF